MSETGDQSAGSPWTESHRTLRPHSTLADTDSGEDKRIVTYNTRVETLQFLGK